MAWVAAIPVIAAAVSAVSGYLGQQSAAKSEKEKRKLLNQARAEFEKIEVPEEKAAVYEELKRAGVLTPEFEKEINIPDTEYTKVQADPALKQAQLNALTRLTQLGESGGLDEADKANLERARQKFAAESASQQGAAQESLARRGLQSAGAEMVQRQMAAQGEANQMADFERQTQGEARRRALEAMIQGGSLAGGIRSQDVGEQERKAAAIDAINRFRVQNQADVQQRNVERINQAAAGNLQNQQRIQDANVAFRNQSTDLNRGAEQRAFQNQITRAQGMASPIAGQAAAAGQAAQQTRDMWGGLATGIGQLGAAYQQGSAADQQQANADRDYALRQQELNQRYQ